jgi:RHS repeat-associated protein
MTIYGTGFNATVANNVVKFTKTNGAHGSSGAPATVTAATQTTLVVTVPSGIKSGSIFVKNQSSGLSDEIGDVAGEKTFTLDGVLTPTVSTVAPTTARPGDTITITGSRFVANDPMANNVTINNSRARVTSASSTQLQAIVPPLVGSGSVEVRTPDGLVKGPDLFVPEDGVDIASFTNKIRATSGSSNPITVTAAGQTAVLAISATKGQRIGIKASGATGALASNQASITVIDPMGRPFGGSVSIASANKAIMAVDALYDGDYAILIKKLNGTAALSANITVVASDVASGGTISVGQTATMAITQLGGAGTFRIAGTQGQTFNFNLTGLGGSASAVSLFAPSLPDGDPVGDGIVETTEGNGLGGDFALALPETGTYIYRYAPNPFNTDPPAQNVTVQVSLVAARIASPPTPEASAGTFITSREQARAVADIVAAAGQGEEAWAPDPDHLDVWTTGRAPSLLENAPLPAAADGATALAGRALRLNGAPLVGATVTVGDSTALTGSAGEFLLTGLRPGRAILQIDGASASTPDRTYGSFQIGVDLVRGRTSTLEQVIWMPLLDTEHTVRVSFPTRREIVITNPTMPGLEVRIPAGARITDDAGEPVREIGLTPVPLDRTPFPMPFDGFRMHFTLQPSGAHVDTGFEVTYPNASGLPARQKVGVYTYEPDEGWERYGSARVSPNAEQIRPTKGTRAYSFTGVSWLVDIRPSVDAACAMLFNALFGHDMDSCLGDPIDATNGTWRYAQTDLVEPGPMPIRLERIYRQNDGFGAHQFGAATASMFEMVPTTTDENTFIDLYIPGGRTVHFTPIGASGVPMRASAGQGRFAGAVLDQGITPYWGGVGAHIVRLADGSRYIFAGLHHRLREIRDRFNNALVLNWDNTDRLTAVTSYPSGRWISFARNSHGEVTAATDQSGRTVTYTYENPATNVYRLKTITDPKQQGLPSPAATTYGWDPSTVINANPSPADSPGTHLVSISDPRGNAAMAIGYDASGRVDVQTLANGGAWTYGYNLASDPACAGAGSTKVTDPNGNVTCARFTGDYLDSITKAAGTTQARTTTYVRDPSTKKVTSMVDTIASPGPGDPATNRTTTMSYDADERLTSITRLAGTGQAVTTSYAYAPAYAQITLVDKPLNDDVHLSYNDGCLTRVEDDLGKGITMTCTSSGLTKTLTDDLSNQTSLTYARGDLIKTTDPLSRSTSRFIDGAGRPTVLTDPLGYRTTLSYSALDELVKITDANAQTTTMVYDANSNLTDLTQDASGGHIAWSYDSIDRIATRTDQLGRVETYTYDLNGNVKTWQNRRGQTQRYCYEAFDRVSFVGYDGPDTGATCASSFASTTAYTWDNGGRLRQVTDSIAGTITRAYDDLDRLTSETTPQGQITSTWDDSSRRTTMTVAGQPQVSYDYFRSDLPKTITQGAAVVSYTYDAANRPDKLTLANAIVQDYTFDAASGLTKISYDKGATNYGVINYTYDGAGRRHGQWGSWARTGLPAATTANATYNAQNQLTSWNGTAVGYDLDANMTSNGATTFSWDARGQLSATSQGSVGYGYDGLGRRISRSVSGTTQARYLYDGLQMIQEQGGTGAAIANTLAGQGLDQPLRRAETSGTTRDLLTDGIGSVIGLADGAATPTVPTSYTYEPYGTQTFTGTASTNPFGFTAREFDAANGLQFNRARYTNPTFGRFVSEDPIDVAGGLNLYAYAGDAPTVFTDPFGLEPGSGGGCGTLGLICGWHWVEDHGWNIAGCLEGAQVALEASEGISSSYPGRLWQLGTRGAAGTLGCAIGWVS